MGSDENRRADRNRSNWENDRSTSDQRKTMRKMGEDPSNYRDTKGEASNVIRSAGDGSILGKTSNDLRKARKWLQDDI